MSFIKVINDLSRITVYIESYAINRNNGEWCKRANATGFFVKTENKILLVTNWHVVTGLDPNNPQKNRGRSVPEVLKITVISKDNMITELSLPLYNKELEPLWREHPERNTVDLIVLPISMTLDKYFHIFDIFSELDSHSLTPLVGKDVFILGYPFDKDSLKESFDDFDHYFLPIWKRGSIASEPSALISDKVILIDSLTRAGMSGSPVVLSEDVSIMVARTKRGQDVLKRIDEGDVLAITESTPEDIGYEQRQKYSILGVYSGVVGTTKLQELALGKCWHIDVLQNLIENQIKGKMPYHAPLPPHPYYEEFVEQTMGVIIRIDSNGENIETIRLSKEYELPSYSYSYNFRN
ncbi:serine protease [Psychrobium sp. MM17-31]|uniref:S1 family peptidase n=1 Tax=Psychrobium sp. MM17-31 TaxID=2917758 RepID=UPI001EF52794|nr:serine protease [Psychrobium sp. MM17-31]MCG7532553.1 serine protease [Psychrobium sp. MM17-31]